LVVYVISVTSSNEALKTIIMDAGRGGRRRFSPYPFLYSFPFVAIA